MFEIFIGLAFIVILYFILTSQKKVIMGLYRQQAAKRNGKVKRHLLFFPKLILFDQGREILIYQDPGSQNSPPTTHMKCTLDSMKEYKISIVPENALIKIGKSLGMKDIQIGNSEFDETFLVRGNDEMAVRTLLLPEIQESIIELEERYPTINIANKDFEFNISGWLKKEKQFDPFIEAGLKIIKKANEI
jgi:hypothetical protein